MEKEQPRASAWLHFRVSAEVYDTIKALAEQERRSISQMGLFLVEESLATRRKKAQS